MKEHSSSRFCPSKELHFVPLDYAYRLLARRAYSEHGLAEKMLTKGFTEGAVARTVARLKEQGYLNDAQLAEDLVERLRKRGFGSERIRNTRTQRGIDATRIEEALVPKEQYDELADARQFLASRYSVDALKQPKVYARAFRLLSRRGYAHDIVESLLGSAPSDD
jgi:regulatory protein